MSRDREEAFVQQARKQLDRHADQLDELTVARLRAARKAALDSPARLSFTWLPLTGLAGVAAALLAVVIWYRQPDDIPLTGDDWDVLAASDELELIEDLEFYDWLESTQSSS